MRPEKRIDKLFHDHLNQRNEAVSEGLWDRIEQNRSFRDKLPNYFFGYWKQGAIVSSILLLLLISSLLGENKQKTKPLTSKTPPKTCTESSVAKTKSISENYTTQRTAPQPKLQKSSKLLSLQSTNLPMKLKSNTTTFNHNTSKLTPRLQKHLGTMKVEPTLGLLVENNQQAVVPLERLENPTPLLAITSNVVLPDLCYSFKNREGSIKAFTIDFLVSPDRTYKKLGTKEPTEDYAYLQARKNTETSRFSFSSIIRLSVILNTGFAIRTGLGYSQINEKFKYQNGNEVHIDIRHTYDNTGKIIASDTITTSGTRIITAYNRYRSIDIPIMMGFEIPLSQKIALSVNGGAFLNMRFSTKGEFMTPEGIPASFTSKGSKSYPAFRDNVGASLYGSLALNFFIKKNVNLLVEPYIKHGPNSVTLDSYSLNQKYTNIGAYAGLRLSF